MKKFKKLNIRFLYCNLFLYGFIVFNLYNAKLSSYLTTPNKGYLIKTIDDIINWNITLLDNADNTRNNHFYMYDIKAFYDKYPKFKRVFDNNISTQNFYKHLNTFDRNYGYYLPDYMWSYYKLSQHLLDRKLFSFSNEFCSSYGIIYPMNLGGLSQFDEFFTVFTMKVLQSGLLYIWEQFTYRDLEFQFIRNGGDILFKLNLKYYKIAWVVFGFGIVLSVFAFVIEIKTSLRFNKV